MSSVHFEVGGDLAQEMRPVTPGTLAWAFDRLRGLIGVEPDPERLIGFVHAGAPASKARARWSRKTRRFYTPEKTETEESALAWRFKSSVNGRRFDGNLALLAIFYRPNYQRIDADNLLKLVLDAGTKAGAWRDDCQVTTQGAIIEYDAENPRTLIAFCDCQSSLDRGEYRFERPCQQCGEMFVPDSITRAKVQKFCSPACNARSRGQDLSELVACPQCGVMFKRITAKQKLCSNSCRAESLRGIQKGRAKQKPICPDCGKQTARHDATRCRECWKLARSNGLA